MNRCPECNRPLMADPAHPRRYPWRGAPTWCWFHGRVSPVWVPLNTTPEQAR